MRSWFKGYAIQGVVTISEFYVDAHGLLFQVFLNCVLGQVILFFWY